MCQIKCVHKCKVCRFQLPPIPAGGAPRLPRADCRRASTKHKHKHKISIKQPSSRPAPYEERVAAEGYCQGGFQNEQQPFGPAHGGVQVVLSSAACFIYFITHGCDDIFLLCSSPAASTSFIPKLDNYTKANVISTSYVWDNMFTISTYFHQYY